ncbi:hypothetical protein [Candidatus Nitrosocosmicus franklandus]|nr:hypothetical protein [Candidatus Nitrosocosmicus franklandus]
MSDRLGFIRKFKKYIEFLIVDWDRAWGTANPYGTRDLLLLFIFYLNSMIWLNESMPSGEYGS